MSDGTVETILHDLRERAKELACLYRVHEILRTASAELEEVFLSVVDALPAGWQYPAACRARVVWRGQVFAPVGEAETEWVLRAPLVVAGQTVGSVSVCYMEELPAADEGPFLKEERRLIDTVADRLSQFLLHRELAAVFGRQQQAGEGPPRESWRVLLDMLVHTDRTLLARITRKILNHLSVLGLAEAQAWLRPDAPVADENQPAASLPPELSAETVFALATRHLADGEILSLVQGWIREDRVSFLLDTLETSYTSLVELANALLRWERTGLRSADLPAATRAGMNAHLVRRLLSDDPAFVAVCRRFVDVDDFVDLVKHTVLLPKSQGRIGGKSSGVFLATEGLRRSAGLPESLRSVRTPRTWYVPSDGIVRFVSANHLEELYSWKYREVEQIRREYPHIQEVFRRSPFPPDLVHGVAQALSDLGDVPLIVRSSSLLEDRAGSSFSGKYKSLFLGNRGSEPERLAAVLRAVAEVYASTFGPDPIQYRALRGLLDEKEEMAVMIQAVVGRRVGRYWFPAFAGVAFSRNELRWSPRIRREDGLLRLVPGLGTRAVDRLGDDYPVLVAPGQPGLRINASPDEVIRYAPRRIDVIDLARNAFTTLELEQLLAEVGAQYPLLPQLVSVLEEDGHLHRPGGGALLQALDPRKLLFTFEGLVTSSPFVGRVRELLGALADVVGGPVDLEFACEGEDLYLLQCRPQNASAEAVAVALPREVAEDRVVFTATRYVSTAAVENVTHVVYVDADEFARLRNEPELRAVGRAVGRLNAQLPRRRFILMGPGRWGSRGDLRLGVSVTYADICNTALLVEVARRRGQYVPDLSFGTHFFQDLVEARIAYLPLYPDDPGVVFNESFLRQAPSVLEEFLPGSDALARVLRVIDVPRATGGLVLRVLMSGEEERALAFLARA